MTPGKQPLSVDFWFSLGHSRTVFALVALLSLGVRSLAGQVEDPLIRSASHHWPDWNRRLSDILYIIGIINLGVLVGILKVFRRTRASEFDEAALEDQLNNRGMMDRLLDGLTKAITKPWQMYPVGLLFGLGFDTATEVGLLVLAGGAPVLQPPVVRRDDVADPLHWRTGTSTKLVTLS